MYLLLSPTGPIALLEGICRFVPSLVRIDPGAVELPADGQPTGAPGGGGGGSPPETQSNASSGVHSGDSNSNSNSRGVGYSLEWREFKSLAAAAGLPLTLPSTKATNALTPVAEEDNAEAEAGDEAKLNAEGLGKVKGEESPAMGNTDTLDDTRQPEMAVGSGTSSSISAAVESDASEDEPTKTNLDLACGTVGDMVTKTEVAGGTELETSMEMETEMEVGEGLHQSRHEE